MLTTREEQNMYQAYPRQVGIYDKRKKRRTPLTSQKTPCDSRPRRLRLPASSRTPRWRRIQTNAPTLTRPSAYCPGETPQVTAKSPRSSVKHERRNQARMSEYVQFLRSKFVDDSSFFTTGQNQSQNLLGTWVREENAFRWLLMWSTYDKSCIHLHPNTRSQFMALFFSRAPATGPIQPLLARTRHWSSSG